MKKQSALTIVSMVLLAGLGLSACGGGGSGGAPSAANPTGGTPVTATPQDADGYYVPGLAMQTDGRLSIQLVDPNSPARAVFADTTTNFVAPRAARIDASAGTVTVLPAPKAYYAKAGKVYELSLRKQDATAPIQISSLTNACYVSGAIPMNAAATDSWVWVATGGADGDCNVSTTDTAGVWVRTGSPTSTAASTLPTGVRAPSYTLPIYDQQGNAIAIPVIDTRSGTSVLSLLKPDFTMGPVVSNSDHVSDLMVVNGDPSNPQAAYVKINGDTLRRITWSGLSATLSATLHTFATASYATPGATDASGMYFADGATLWHVTGANAPTQRADFSSSLGNIDMVYVTTNHVVVHQQRSVIESGAPTLYDSIASVLKSGGTVTRLAADSKPGTRWLLGTQDDTVLFRSTADTAPNLDTIHQIPASGGADRLLASDIYFVSSQYNRVQSTGGIWAPGAWVSSAALDALVYCEPLAGATQCAGGNIKRYTLANGTSASLGQVDASLRRLVPTEAYLWSDIPNMLWGVGSGPVYLLQPGSPNQLVQLTPLNP